MYEKSINQETELGHMLILGQVKTNKKYEFFKSELVMPSEHESVQLFPLIYFSQAEKVIFLKRFLEVKLLTTLVKLIFYYPMHRKA